MILFLCMNTVVRPFKQWWYHQCHLCKKIKLCVHTMCMCLKMGPSSEQLTYQHAQTWHVFFHYLSMFLWHTFVGDGSQNWRSDGRTDGPLNSVNGCNGQLTWCSCASILQFGPWPHCWPFLAHQKLVIFQKISSATVFTLWATDLRTDGPFNSVYGCNGQLTGSPWAFYILLYTPIAS